MPPLLDDVVEDLVPRLGAPAGAATALGGGLTNANFRIRLGDGDYVLRLPGAGGELLGIDRAAEYRATRLAASAGVGPEVVAFEQGCLVTRYVDGPALEAEELRRPERIEEVAGLLRTIHESGATLPVDFDVFRVVERFGAVARAHGVEPPAGYGAALRRAAVVEAVMTGPEHRRVFCHDDLLPANFVDDGERLWIVDWEYAGMGDRYFDLGNFAVNTGLDADGEVLLLTAYWGEPPTDRRLATLRLMRSMSAFWEAMWGVVQSAVSDLDFDYGAYAARHFERLETTAADPRFDDWLRAARAA